MTTLFDKLNPEEIKLSSFEIENEEIMKAEIKEGSAVAKELKGTDTR